MLNKLKFTVRDLFWLTLVTALALGWWQERGERFDWRSKYETLARFLHREGYSLRVDTKSVEVIDPKTRKPISNSDTAQAISSLILRIG